jgi:hypothetical protein
LAGTIRRSHDATRPSCPFPGRWTHSSSMKNLRGQTPAHRPIFASWAKRGRAANDDDIGVAPIHRTPLQNPLLLPNPCAERKERKVRLNLTTAAYLSQDTKSNYSEKLASTRPCFFPNIPSFKRTCYVGCENCKTLAVSLDCCIHARLQLT